MKVEKNIKHCNFTMENFHGVSSDLFRATTLGGMSENTAEFKGILKFDFSVFGLDRAFTGAGRQHVMCESNIIFVDRSTLKTTA